MEQNPRKVPKIYLCLEESPFYHKILHICRILGDSPVPELILCRDGRERLLVSLSFTTFTGFLKRCLSYEGAVNAYVQYENEKPFPIRVEAHGKRVQEPIRLFKDRLAKCVK